VKEAYSHRNPFNSLGVLAATSASAPDPCPRLHRGSD
jgi:hypothetical protein